MGSVNVRPNTGTQDVDGKRYIDFIGMFSAVNTGHCHPHIQKIVIEQLKKGIPREARVCKWLFD
jgi:4-aminobutyrate aminotransferase-like enzyme